MKFDGSNEQSIITDNIRAPYGISLGIIYIYVYVAHVRDC
jgi:hypothetical protein